MRSSMSRRMSGNLRMFPCASVALTPSWASPFCASFSAAMRSITFRRAVPASAALMPLFARIPAMPEISCIDAPIVGATPPTLANTSAISRTLVFALDEVLASTSLIMFRSPTFRLMPPITFVAMSAASASSMPPAAARLSVGPVALSICSVDRPAIASISIAPAASDAEN